MVRSRRSIATGQGQRALRIRGEDLNRHGDAPMLRSNFLISEFCGDETRVLTGWAGHRVLQNGTGWKIQAKQVNLIDCDQCIRNLIIIL